MKNCDRRAVDIASNEALSAQVPQKPKSRLNRKFSFFTASALICASLGLAPSVKAGEALTLTGIQSALQAGPQALTSQQAVQPAGDAAVSALSSFAQQIGTPAARADRPFDDQAFASLQDFAQRLGTAQPQSIKALPKVAEADNHFDFLRQGGSAPADSEKAKSPAGPSKRSGPPVEAHFVGGKACLTCHAGAVAEFEKTLMGRLSKTQKGKFECENCHGPGSAHVKAGGGRGVGGIMGFGANDPRTAEEKNSACLGCHERGNRTLWQGSTHEERGLACTNCHTVMKDVSRKHNLKTSFEPDTCFQCHKDRRAQMFRSSHMPVREGKMVCSDCHNPHGSATEALLKKDSINDVCYTCHAEKRGPFLFEHAPVRENCDNCHDSHGTVQQSSLKMAMPRLCSECHNLMTQTDNRTSNHAMGQSCLNCHTAIHGSNAPNGQLLFR